MMNKILSSIIFLTLSQASSQPLIFEEFNGWTGTNSPDGLWRRAGNWNGTGNNLLSLNNAIVSSTYNGKPGGYLTLTIRAGKLEGGEIQTIGPVGSSLGYGYYEVRMKVSDVSGGCNSFFWKEVDYGPGEIDQEFLTNEKWTATSGKVHCQLHEGNFGGPRNLPFSPSQDFHRYGFLYTKDKIEWTADGLVIQTLSRPTTPLPTTKGYIMMNAWTGSANWGGGPPTQDASAVYDWVKFWPGVDKIPEEASGVRWSIKPKMSRQDGPVIFSDVLGGGSGVRVRRSENDDLRALSSEYNLGGRRYLKSEN